MSLITETSAAVNISFDVSYDYSNPSPYPKRPSRWCVNAIV